MTADEWPLVVTFGEMLLRLSPGDQPRLFESDQMRTGFGGAEANVAVALSHLEVWCEYVTRLPDSLMGDAALATMRAEGVQLSHVLRGPERMGLYFVEPGADVGNSRVLYDRAASAFANVVPTLMDWPAILADADWFHATGITAALGEGPLATLRAGVDCARASQVPVSIDLNYRPALWRDRNPAPFIAPLVQGVDLLIGNPHSVRAMLGIHVADDALATSEGATVVARAVAAQCGCRMVALTRREILGNSANRWSASLYDAATGDLSSSRPWTVTVIDRIGGGDSFAASLIASLLRHRAPPDDIRWLPKPRRPRKRCVKS